MQATEGRRAVAAATATASALGLPVRDAVVLQDSNRLTLRLLPGDVLAQVAPAERQVARLEIELARQLTEAGSPVAALDPRVEPRVHQRDGFVMTFWTYYEPATSPEVRPADYADALQRLHAGMRELDVPTPHFTDRVGQAQQLVASRDRTPALADADRELLGTTLRRLRRTVGGRGRAEQLLHGEPHPGNVLTTSDGLRFIDLETCCRGPVEFDLAHAPEEVGEHYPDVDRALLRECRILVLAMVTTWRWDRDDQLPDGRRLGVEWLAQIRAALDGDAARNPPVP
jgi:aminoglycoside phosphotransferase (APT) family kinase protein